MKTILITGGAGFIGSNLCKKLLNEGHKVICLDNFYTGKMENIKEFLLNKNFILKPLDVEDNIFSNIEFAVDEIYNLACPASPPAYQKNPIKTFTTSINGALQVLELAKIYKARVLQASTSEIYGNPLIHPQKEDYWGNVNPIGIRSCYDEGKRGAETLFSDYYRIGVDTCIVRIFNTYGINMDANDGRVISNFINQALKNEDITIYGDGTQTRSFCYIDDLVDGLITIMNSKEHLPINLGNPYEFTINELADIIISKINTKSKIIYKDLPLDDPIKRKPDIYKANELCWKPKISLSEGLDKTIKYYRSLL